MAEIKSTLDIIMEKTKGMTLSDAERQAIARRELASRVKGWVQKYLDRMQDAGELCRELDRLDPQQRPEAVELLVEALVASLNPGGDNLRVLAALREAAGKDTAVLEALLEEHERETVRSARERRQVLERALAEEGLRGSALTANLEADGAWTEETERRAEALREQARRALA